MEPRISIITLGVKDLEKATDFYKNGLGFPLREDDSSSYISFFQLNGFLLALYPSQLLAEDAGVVHERATFSGITLAHNVSSKDEVDALLALAKELGAFISKPAELKEWGGYSGYFQDFDGHLWEIAWSPQLVVDKTP